MRRKRLQHVADTLCQMFCGWRLVNSSVGWVVTQLFTCRLHSWVFDPAYDVESLVYRRDFPPASVGTTEQLEVAVHGLELFVQ